MLKPVSFYKFCVLLELLFLVGCGRITPLQPLPPVIRPSNFETLIDSLQTPVHTWYWLQQFSVYDLGYNLGWQSGADDQAYLLAQRLWSEYHGGKSRGVCGQFAALYVVAARSHGYACGGFFTYDATSGHARSWIVEKDGSISISDNQNLQRSVYKTYDEFLQMCRSYRHYELLDNKFKVLERK